MNFFIVLVKNVGIRKNMEMKKYFNHLGCDGNFQCYTTGLWHNEVTKKQIASIRVDVDEDMGDQLEDM